MKIKKQTEIWTTRDLQEIRVCDMDDGHLLNTYNMLARNVERVGRALDVGPLTEQDILLTIARVYGRKGIAIILELLRRHRAVTLQIPDDTIKTLERMKRG